MISSFYNARSGVLAQEQAMNVIANNLSNVNTSGYKSEAMGFADLLYGNMNRAEGEEDRARAGAGVRPAQVAVSFAQGAMAQSERELDFALAGEGFFAVRDPVSGETSYTRDGSFRKSLRPDGFYLTTAAGALVVNVVGEPVLFAESWPASPRQEHLQIGVYRFANPYGLMKTGNNLYAATEDSRQAAIVPAPDLRQGYLERSNVDVATEMARVIETQRAFQMSARLVSLSDEMEQQLNSLRN
ncbi:MAG: flagellar hook-basal body protein [Gracilibacteraceae bacterium]|jgi:flagellar basal-body rod protein FlgG|nr:flagellar hook-basal body protein [Gracilibacteraceae bacterium]